MLKSIACEANGDKKTVKNLLMDFGFARAKGGHGSVVKMGVHGQGERKERSRKKIRK